MHVRRSRVLLLVAVAGLAAALLLGVVLVPQQAEAKRTSAKQAKLVVYEARLRRTLTSIRSAREEAWRWEAVMSAPRPRYAATAERSPRVCNSPHSRAAFR